MKQKSVMLALVFASILALVGVAQIFAQGPNPRNPRAPRALVGTAFTYQGQLKDNGTPANGAYDFQFALFDAASGGTQIGATLNLNDVTVTNGYFTTPLDFGANAFTGDARYLEIAVRPGASSGAYTPLTPRQALTPTPYALALPGLYTQQNATSPNLIGGFSGNIVTSTLVGVTIGGGGSSIFPNRGWFDYATIGGGRGNIASNDSATVGGGFANTASGWISTVAGGENNVATGDNSTVAGGTSNHAYNASTTVGGGDTNEASGMYSTIAGGHTNTASNENAAVAGGANNTASGPSSFISGGNGNIASATFATVPGGQFGLATHFGEMAYANGRFSATGDAQTSTYVLRNTTANNTPTELFLDGASSRLTIATNRVLTFDILVVGVNVNNGNAAGYRLAGVIKNIGGITSFIGTPNQVILGEDAAGWDATVVADNTNDALVVQVTGVPMANIRWVATVRTVEVAN